MRKRNSLKTRGLLLRLTISSFYATVLLMLTACSGDQQSIKTAAGGETAAPAASEDEGADAGDASDQKYPDVVDAELESTGGTWTLEVTMFPRHTTHRSATPTGGESSP
jgi:hypothetical protein